METSLQNILQQYPRLFPEKEKNSIREWGERNIPMLHSYITVCINYFLWKANSYQSTTKNHLTQFNFLIITNDRLPFLSSFLNLFFFYSLQLNLLYQSFHKFFSIYLFNCLLNCWLSSVRQSVSVCQSIYHSFWISWLWLPAHLSVWQSFFLSVHLIPTIILAVSSSVCLSVCLSVFLSVHLSVFLSVLHPLSLMNSWCLSVCLLIGFSNRNSGKVTPKTRFPAFVSFPINFMQPLPSLLQILSLASLFVSN